MACGCGCGCNGQKGTESWYSGGAGGSGGGSVTGAAAASEESPGFQVAGLSWWVWLLIASAAYSIWNYQS